MSLLATTLSYPMSEGRSFLLSNKRPAENATDDEFDWYTPIAVILRPASSKDIQKQVLDTYLKGDGAFPQSQHPLAAQQLPQQPYPYYDSFPPPFSVGMQHPFYDFNQPPLEQPTRFPYQQNTPPFLPREEDGDDRLREFYESYNDLPSRVQSNLLNLARMGLVAIRRKEVNSREDDDENNSKINNEKGKFHYIGQCVEKYNILK